MPRPRNWNDSAAPLVIRSTPRTARAERRCASCRCVLASDNPGVRCSPCEARIDDETTREFAAATGQGERITDEADKAWIAARRRVLRRVTGKDPA